MFQGRAMKKLAGSSMALLGVVGMVGVGGAVEAGTISVGGAFLRMVIGCLLVLGGAWVFGGLE